MFWVQVGESTTPAVKVFTKSMCEHLSSGKLGIRTARAAGREGVGGGFVDPGDFLGKE